MSTEAEPVTIKVQSLFGIPSEHQQLLYEAMRSCTNQQRLAVCLLFMSNLPDSRRRLADIERELKLIFPPSARDLTPSSYVDFQAAAVRHYFNAEKRRISDEAQRLWERVRRGCWRNTSLGNSAAIRVLESKRIVIVLESGEPLLAREPLPVATRAFLEDAGKDSILDELGWQEAENEPEQENLLATVDRVLDALPTVDPVRIPSVPPSVSLQFAGMPQDVQNGIRAIMDNVMLRRASITLTIDQEGWHVTLVGS